jgi:uncharacterized protein (DUF362 family)/ferredoxin
VGDCLRNSIHVTRCQEYDAKVIKRQLVEHLDLYPRFKDLNGKKVLIKVNLLSATSPEKMVTTHPTFVEALINIIHERGGKTVIGDSPGGLFNESMLKKCYRETGLQKIAERTGTELNLNTSSHAEKHHKGRFVKSFNICDYVRDCDLIIAAPKIKTHMFCGLTCASKIMFGAIPGTEKVGYHTRFPDNVDFSKMLLDLTDACNVDLFLVDGIIGMEGKGPARGNPRSVGAIISGTDHFEIDRYVIDMTGLKPETIPLITAAEDLGILERNSRPEITGSGSDLRLDPPFKGATTRSLMRNLPLPVRRSLINLTTAKPFIRKRECVGCGVCRDNCAGDAIDIVDGKARIKYGKCIRCYCCHELCPHDAVGLLERNILAPLRNRLNGS